MHSNRLFNFDVCMPLHNLYYTSNLCTFPDRLSYPGLEKFLGKADRVLVQCKFMDQFHRDIKIGRKCMILQTLNLRPFSVMSMLSLSLLYLKGNIFIFMGFSTISFSCLRKKTSVVPSEELSSCPRLLFSYLLFCCSIKCLCDKEGNSSSTRLQFTFRVHTVVFHCGCPF